MKLDKMTYNEMLMHLSSFAWLEDLIVLYVQFRLGDIDVHPLSVKEKPPVYCRMFDSLLSVRDQCRRQSELSQAESEEQRKVSKQALQVCSVSLRKQTVTLLF